MSKLHNNFTMIFIRVLIYHYNDLEENYLIDLCTI